MTESRCSPHPWRRRALIGLISSMALLGAGMCSLLLVNPAVIEEQLRDWVLPHIAEQLGHPVEVESIRVSLFPPRAELESVRVASSAGQPPLVEVPAARATFELLPLLLSRGADVRIGTIRLDKPHINLVRARNGRWNFQGTRSPHEQPLVMAEDDFGGESRQVTVDKLRIHDGTVSILNVTANVPRIVLEHVDVKGHNLSTEHAVRLDVAAAFASRRQNVKGAVYARPGSGGLGGTVAVDSFDVARLREVVPAGIGRVLVGGRAVIEARFAAKRGRFDASGHVDARRLSFGAKPADADFDFTIHSRPQRPSEPIVRMTRVHLRGPGINLAGNAWIGRRNRFGFDASGPLLDIDAMLPAAAKAGVATRSRPRPGATRALRMAMGSGHLAVERVIVHRLRADDLDATVRIRGSELELVRGTARVAGGVIDASGSRLTMARNGPAWHLRASLDNVDFGQAVRQAHGRSPAEGKLDAKLDIRGASFAWKQLRPTLAGSGSFALEPGASGPADFTDGVAEAPADLESAAGKPSKSKKRARIESLAGTFTVSDGFLRFDHPLEVRLNSGKASLFGTVGLDGRLDLRGKGLVNPRQSMLSWLKLRKPIATDLTLGGTVVSPKLHVSKGDIAKAVVARAPPVKLVRVIRNLFRRHRD